MAKTFIEILKDTAVVSTEYLICQEFNDNELLMRCRRIAALKSDATTAQMIHKRDTDISERQFLPGQH